MALPKAFINNRGFTLIELSVTMGLLVILGSLGLFMSMDSMRSGAFRDDRDTAVSGLQRARSLAVNNMCFGATCTEGVPHGVRFYPKGDPNESKFVIFQGVDYDHRESSADEIIEYNNRTTYVDDSSIIDIVFDRLSGNAITKSVTLKDNAGHASIIDINSEGRIDWTN